MKFTPTNHHNPCPICRDTSGDCRTTEDNVVLCHEFIEQDSGTVGYRWIKPSSNGVWGVHVPDDGKEFDFEAKKRHSAWKKAKERNKQQFLAENALDADGRDEAIRKLACHIGLSDCHRENLRTRGLNDHQIEEGLFFSVDPQTRLSLDLPPNLPGVRDNYFTTKVSGCACPAFDKQRRAISWQLRVDGVTKGNKYRWAKSLFSSQLANSEYPLTIIQPDKNSCKRLHLCEGFLKPFIASQRHEIPVCGAANNGNFQGSPEQLAEIVADYDEIAIVPDGGDVLNSQVMNRWSKQIDYLKQFNKPIKVLWWEQVKKTDGDIDEIDSVTFLSAKYLIPKEFLELAKKEQYIQQQRENWSNYKKFTPQTKIEKKFVEFGLPQSDTITFIKSGLGSGKTTETVKHLLQLRQYGIIGLGYRNTLLLQFNEKAKKVGFYHLQSDKNLREFSLEDPAVKVTNCIDSLVHYEPDHFDGKIIVIDEVISVLKHLLFSSTIKQFTKVKELFTEMVNRCNRLICLDGFIQDWAVTFFKELCPSKQIVTIENIHRGNKAQVYLLEGTIDHEEKTRANDKTPWLKELLNSDCPAIASDSQVFCEAIEKLLKEQGRTGIRVDSKTVCEERVKEFFTDPDKYIRENKPEYLIYSPSAESGLDVPTKNYFDAHFAFFFGQLDIDSMIQMIGRIRDTSVPKYIWAKKFILTEDIKRRPSNVESIQADRARRIMAELHSTLNSIESPEAKIAYLQQVYQNNLDPYTTAADTISAIRNYEFTNYREYLKQQLIDSGYSVKTATPERLDDAKAIAKQEREAKIEVKEQNSKDIYNASDKYVGQHQINLKFDANWETRCAVIKAGLIARLPGIDLNPVWGLEFIKLIKYDRPDLINQNRLYYLLENPELAKQLSLEKYNGIFNRGSLAAPWKLRQDYLKVKTLRDVGLYDFIQTAIKDPDFTYNADSLEVKGIINKCRRKKHQSLLGVPGKDSIKFINKLLHLLGIKTRARKIKKQGRTIRVYSLDQKHLLSKERLAILQAIKSKYEEKNNSDNGPLEWIINSEMNKTNQKPKFSDSQDATVFDSREAIADLANMLLDLECAEGLRELQKVPVFTSDRLNNAAKLLPLEWQQKLRQWAIENQRKRSA